MIYLEKGTIVKENINYEVSESGNYELLDFVPCQRIGDNEATCAFLAVSVIGQENSGNP